MENCLAKEELYNKKLELYKNQIDIAIKDIIDNNERLVFANVVKKGNITNIIVFKFPKLRNYILEEIRTQKEIQYINKKIDRIINGLIKREKRVTFVGVMSRCKFTTEEVYRNPYIKEKIRSMVIKESNGFYSRKK